MMSDQELTALFTLADAEAEPALRPGFTEQTVTVARRSVRRRRVGGAFAMVLAVLVAGTAPALLGAALDGGDPAAPKGRPSLPDRFAGYSVLTATVTRKPAGRAIALYNYGNDELFDTRQPLVVGADRDTYRRVDAIEARGATTVSTFPTYPGALLSPDGTKVLVGDERGNATSLVLVDLITGRQRVLRVDPPVGVLLLAWSPDGRYVAYGGAPVHPTPSAPPGTVIIDDRLAETRTNSELIILDLAAGTSIHYPQIRPVRSASFAPDSRHLAVQQGREAWIVTVDGQRQRRLALPEGRELLERHAWSPDGALIATLPFRGEAAQGTSCGSTGSRECSPPTPLSLPASGLLVFVDSTGAGRPVPPPVDVGASTLGWRSPTQLVTFGGDEAGVGGNIVEVAVDTGERRVLSRFSDSASCEYGLRQCEVGDLQLATGLLAALDTRPAGDPDRGPWPFWLALTCLGLAATLAALGGLTAWTIRRWRRRQRRHRFGSTRTAPPRYRPAAPTPPPPGRAAPPFR